MTGYLDTPVLLRHIFLAFPVSIKTLDALHIASLLIFTDVRPKETVLVFSFDSGMNRGAKALGFTVPFSQ
jgi:hypothetical protein